MSVRDQLTAMFAELADGDLNAIRKARGFSLKETASPTSFASYYLTSIGLAKVLDAISLEETIALRLLHETGEVDVSFFERLYGAGFQYGTFTQRYKTTFDRVKKDLVRRGLVVMAADRQRRDVARLQSWRFMLPPEFVPHLRPLPTVQDDQPGRVDERTIRRTLIQLINAGVKASDRSFYMEAVQGSLYLNDRFFSMAVLRDWQLNAWKRDMEVPAPRAVDSPSPIEAALRLLSSEHWTDPRVLETALRIYCFGAPLPPIDRMLHRGWELGLLSQLAIDSVDHYRRLAVPDHGASGQEYPPSLGWAGIAAGRDSISIDLERVPLVDLGQLNLLLHLVVHRRRLIGSASPVKVARCSPAERNTALSHWLARQMPAFGAALETANAMWGKTIVHHNLLIARVRDLSLRVQLERELTGSIVVLSDQFIAFPHNARAGVEKVLKKAGFVVKTVKA